MKEIVDLMKVAVFLKENEKNLTEMFSDGSVKKDKNGNIVVKGVKLEDVINLQEKRSK